jgi:putative addiction module component (TIGR02574 family)
MPREPERDDGVEGLVDSREVEDWMRTVAEELELAVLGLPAGDRARLAKRLIESLDQDPDVEAQWDEEIARRVARIEAGEANLVPAEDVFRKARRLIGGS